MTDEGESSTSSSETDDLPTKKARFMWQIKGQYRLKNEGSKDVYTNSEEDIAFMNAVYRWRNHHMAKAVFDNAVNSVIENMGFPYPGIENLMDSYGNGNLEDEAVEMAIRCHGLQKACSCPSNHVITVPNMPFHRRAHFSINGGSSSSRFAKEERSELEHDFLSKAVTVAIQKKGLGAYTKADNA